MCGPLRRKQIERLAGMALRQIGRAHTELGRRVRNQEGGLLFSPPDLVCLERFLRQNQSAPVVTMAQQRPYARKVSYVPAFETKAKSGEPARR